MDWVTTTLLLERLHDYEDSVWRSFTERFHRPVVRFARCAGLSDVEAEDVAQETLLGFARAYRDGRYDRNRGSLHTWLFGIAHHKVVDAIRVRRRRSDKGDANRQDTTFWTELTDDEARQHWESSWEEAFLHQSLRLIRKEFRESTWRAFELLALQGAPAAEVAEHLGMSRNAVSIAKHRVLQRLRELRAEYEGS